MLRIRENIVIVLFYFFGYAVTPLRYNRHRFDFYIMQTCTRSEQEEINRVFAQDLDECKYQVKRMRGLAFNYVEPDLVKYNKSNCIIYECPDFNVTALKQTKSVYHYYSAYARIYPSENMTCVPMDGVYVLTREELNYTEAMDKCEEYGGRLMDVMTEEASYRAKFLIENSKIRSHANRLQAYVGLDDIEREGYFRNWLGDLLNRLPWRAWAPGEPRNAFDNEDCVTIDSFRHWRVHRCNKRLPFICEILPDGPLNLTEAYCLVKENAEDRKKCFEYYATNNTLNESEICNQTTSKGPSNEANATKSEGTELRVLEYY